MYPGYMKTCYCYSIIISNAIEVNFDNNFSSKYISNSVVMLGTILPCCNGIIVAILIQYLRMK